MIGICNYYQRSNSGQWDTADHSRISSGDCIHFGGTARLQEAGAAVEIGPARKQKYFIFRPF
jgi:hypothetical protein